MDNFSGLDISMEETHVCVVDRDGAVVHEAKTASTPEAIGASLAKSPACRRIVFETGRMAPTLYHGLGSACRRAISAPHRHSVRAQNERRRRR
jgi:transposase